MSGSEMQMVAWPLEQPAFDEFSFMGGVVIENQMDMEVIRDGMVKEVEKLPELLTAVLGKASPDDLAGGNVKSGEKSGGAMAKVVRCASFDLSGLQGKNGLGTA